MLTDTCITADRIAKAMRGLLDTQGKADAWEVSRFLHRGAPTLQPIIYSALLEAEARGLTRPCPNPGEHKGPMIPFWDEGVRNGFRSVSPYGIKRISRKLTELLWQTYEMWMYDPTGAARAAHPTMSAMAAAMREGVKRVETITEAHLCELGKLFADVLREPKTPLYEQIDVTVRSKADNRIIALMWDGWTPCIATKDADGPLTYLPEPPAQPPIRHYTLPAAERVLIFSSSNSLCVLCDSLSTEAVDKVGLGDDFTAHTGVNQHARDVHAATGMFEIHLGDYFPKLMLDRGVLRGTTDPQIKYPDDVTPLSRRSLDNPVIGSYEAALALTAAHPKVADLEEARRLIDDAIKEGLILEVPASLNPASGLHLYAPDGWRADDFESAMSKLIAERGFLSEIPDEMTYFVLSPEQLDIPEDLMGHIML